jgi:hypothetical protein
VVQLEKPLRALLLACASSCLEGVLVGACSGAAHGSVGRSPGCAVAACALSAVWPHVMHHSMLRLDVRERLLLVRTGLIVHQ